VTQSKLIGVWHLISGEFHYSDGTIKYPWGENPDGQIIYTDSGYMTAQLMRPNRPNFKFKDHMKGTDDEVRQAFEGYQAYYGTYILNEKDSIVDHIVQGSVFPNLNGRTLKRHYEISGNRLTLRTPPMKMGGVEVSGFLTWERL
jgi:hypothetical protein